MASRLRIIFIIAIILVSIGTYKVLVIDVGSCGTIEVSDKMITIHTSCKFKVSHGDIPDIRTEKGILYITIPEGWQWRVIPQE